MKTVSVPHALHDLKKDRSGEHRTWWHNWSVKFCCYLGEGWSCHGMQSRFEKDRECFHTRADSKLQWRIVIAIFELPSVHTIEKTFLSLRFSIPERGEAWLVSVFFWHADCLFIWDRISIRKCVVYRRKWLEGLVAPPPPPPITI